jgi:hypothetical protein
MSAEFFNAARDADSPMPLTNVLFQALAEKDFVVFNMAVGYGAQGFMATVIVAQYENLEDKQQVDLNDEQLHAVVQELAGKRGYVGKVQIRTMHGQHIIVEPNLPFLKRSDGSISPLPARDSRTDQTPRTMA